MDCVYWQAWILTRLYGIFVVPGSLPPRLTSHSAYACIKLYYSHPATIQIPVFPAFHQPRRGPLSDFSCPSLLNLQLYLEEGPPGWDKLFGSPHGTFDTQSRGPSRALVHH